MSSAIDKALAAARETKQLRIGRKILGETVEMFRREFGERAAVIVADSATFSAAGRAVADAFRNAGHALVEPFVFTDPDLYAEHRFVDQLEGSLSQHDAIPISVGAGTLNDITKLAAHRAGRSYIAVATAASMDGYTAFGASITYQGSKQTFDCPAPRGVLADLDVIAAAPPHLNAAGYADLLAKLTAGADWIIADALGVEPIDATAWGLVQTPLRASLANPAGVPRGDLASIAPLVEGLMMGGFAMQSYRTSRPASGAEHQFSHLWDMQHHTHEGAAPSHGFKVGVATIAVARFYETLLALPLERLDVEAALAAWPTKEQIEREIDELFPEPEVRAVAMRESLTKYQGGEGAKRLLERLKDVWLDLKHRVVAQLPSSQELASMLIAADAPATPEQIGISSSQLRRGFRRAFHIRRRFTVLDVAARANVMETCLDALFSGTSIIHPAR